MSGARQDQALEAREAWRHRSCAGLEPGEADRLFFTKGGQREALRLCAGCAVRIACELRVLDHDRAGDFIPYGVAAAMTADQRAALIDIERRSTIKPTRPRSVTS